MRGMTANGLLAAALLAAVVVTAASPATADERASLARLTDVGVSVDIAHPVDAPTAQVLVARLASALREAEPPITVREGAADRIRLTVSVRPASATALRGFWLPFSGTYAIGAVRLGVERMVSLPGAQRTFPAVVWQAERTVASAWRAKQEQIMRLLDEMVAELRRARRETVERRSSGAHRRTPRGP